MRLVLLLAITALSALAGMKTDIEFARPAGEPLTLDAYVPDGAGPFPAIIVVHGGGFVQGDKQTYVKPLFPVLTEAGVTWFTINYRLAPKHHFPAPVEDVETAVQWVKAHAKEYKVDVRRMALVGESAGGHLVAYVGARSGRALGIRAVVPFYAPCDLVARLQTQRKLSENMAKFLNVGPELNDESLAASEKAAPITYVNASMPPFLLIHGDEDKLVAHDQSLAMQKKMRAAGVERELFTVNGGAHGMGSWEKLPNGLAYQKRMVEWLRAKLR